MVSYKDLEREITLEDGQSVEGIFDPSSEVSTAQGQMGGTVFVFRLIGPDKKPITIKGGKRLDQAIYRAFGGKLDTPRKIRITATGEARTLARDYDVKVVK